MSVPCCVQLPPPAFARHCWDRVVRTHGHHGRCGRAGRSLRCRSTITVTSPASFAGYRGTSLVTRLDATCSLYEPPRRAAGMGLRRRGRGVSSTVSRVATVGIHIPMPGKVESLNVAAAAAVCLFEAVRRRALNAKRPVTNVPAV